MGYLEQEPHLDEQLNVWGNVIAWCEEKKIARPLQRGRGQAGRGLLRRADGGDDHAAGEASTPATSGTSTRKIEMAMDALRCPPERLERRQPLRRRAPARGAGAAAACPSPTCCCSTSRPTTSTPRSVAWLQHHLEALPRLRDPGHPRPLLPRPGHQVDAGARSRQGRPLRGQLLRLAGAEGQAGPARSRARARRASGRSPRELEWVRSSPSARQAKSKARLAAYDEMVNAAEREKQTYAPIQIPPGPRLGNVVIEVEGLEKEYGDKVLFKDLDFKLPPNGIVGVIGPNGAGKSTLFKLITGQETARRRRDPPRRDGQAGLRRPEPRRPRSDKKTVWEEISGGLDVMKVGSREMPSRAYVGSFNFKGGDQQKKVGQLSGGERNRVHLAKTLTERRQRHPARRADQRPRHRDAAEPGGGARGVRRLRGGDQPRPLVPRPAGHPHPRLRGRQPRRVVRGQLRGLRGGQEAPPGRRLA